MANRVPNNGESLSNESFLSSIRKNAIPAVVMAALAATSGKAEAAWQTAVDFDTNPDGTPAGTSYNDGETIYTFAGTRGGLGFRAIQGTSGVEIQRTNDGTTWTDITSDVLSADAGLASADLDLSGYNPATDELKVRDYNTNLEWVISDASTSAMSAFDLNEAVNSNGSIDISTGTYVGSYYVDSTLRSDVYELTDAGSPSEIYSNNGYDANPQADLANDRLFVSNTSYEVYEVNNVSSSPTRTEITVPSDTNLTNFSPSSYSESGYDELHLGNYSTYDLSYSYDDASYSTTAPVDTDGDGYNDDEDCEPTNASVYPGAPTASDDGVDSDCDENADTPEISSLTVTPATTIAPGDAVSLRASVGDDETDNASLTYEWSVEDSGGTVLETSTSESTSFTTTDEGTFTAYLTVTDAQGNSVTDSTTFDVVDDTVETPASYTSVSTGTILNGTYSGINGSGSATLTNVEVLADNVLYIGEDSSITDASDFEAEFESAAAAGGSTSAEWDGAMIMGMRFAQGSTEYPYADTMNTDEMLYVVLDGETDGNVGSVTVQGSNYDGENLELDETFTSDGEYLVSDIVDDVEDTGGPDDTGPQDTDTGVPDDTGPQDTDTGNVDTDSADTDTEKPSNDDTGVGGGNDGGCNCAVSANGEIPGSFVIGAAAMAALLARRRKEEESK